MTMAASHEVKLELLLGCQVVANDGTPVGRIEEICAREQEGELVVTEYLLGAYGVLERLSVSPISRAMLDLLHLRSGYRVPWDKLELVDVTCPRLICSFSELKELGGAGDRNQ
jgi:sporulation protein YlmC with PRC-barrel domain